MAKVVKINKTVKGFKYNNWTVDARSINKGRITKNPNTNKPFESKKEAQEYLESLVAESKQGFNLNADKLTIAELCSAGELQENPQSNSGQKILIGGGEYMQSRYKQYVDLEKIGLGQYILTERALKKLILYCSERNIIYWKDLNPKKFLSWVLQEAKDNADPKETEDLRLASAWTNFENQLKLYKHLAKWISINKKCRNTFDEIITSKSHGDITFEKPQRLKNLQVQAKDKQVNLQNVMKVRNYIEKNYQAPEHRKIGLLLQFDLIKAIGLRIGEAIALTWDDINFDEICINKQYHYVEKRIKETKHSGVETFVYVGDDLAERLQEYKDIQPNEEKVNNLVFPNTLGNIDTRKALYKQMKKASKALFKEISLHITPHTLRHLFATEMFKQGGLEYLPMVSEILRHKAGTKFTKQQYVHTLKKSEKQIKIQKNRIAELYA